MSVYCHFVDPLAWLNLRLSYRWPAETGSYIKGEHLTAAQDNAPEINLIVDWPLLETFGEGGIIVDTGSSDSILFADTTLCVNRDETVVGQSECRFGPLYSPSSAFSPIGNRKFSIWYGGGEVVKGKVGYSNITLGGITVRQEMGLATSAYWARYLGALHLKLCGTSLTFFQFSSVDVISGILGLSYPSAASFRYGEGSVPYSPILSSMFNLGLAEPFFTLALARGTNALVSNHLGPPRLDLSDGGYLAIGHLGPAVSPGTPFVKTPMLYRHELGQGPFGYNILIEGFSHARNSQDEQVDWMQIEKSSVAVSVDSGTTLIYVPSHVANAINNMFDPPAVLDPHSKTYVVQCNATVPLIAVQISGEVFPIAPADMIRQRSCYPTIQSIPSRSYVLGDVFLRNVFAVFDVGKSEMRFAHRTEEP
ncbi:MAG: hypothetical protein M1818_000105 [Claussenomyces sp. TS43310]|nr:MAG: hypothetical protein M1818_000105 [Claussenomyces sp. TS43310]